MIQSLELLVDDDLDAAVAREWSVLADAGLPSQARHTGATNRPHVTLCVATSVPPAVEDAIGPALAGRFPLPLRLGGLLLFGGRGGRQVLARLVVPDLDLLRLQADCAALFEGLPGPGQLMRPGVWTPHVTLARNLPADRVADALRLLGGDRGRPDDLVGAAVGARRWDGEARRAWPVA